MHHVLMVVGTALWFVLVGALWYSRPGDVVWLVASLALFAVYSVFFLWYLTPRKR